MCTQTVGPVKRRGASHVVAEQGVELAVEVVVGRITVEGFAEPLDVAVKYLGDVGSAEVSVVALVVDRENGVKLFHMMSVFFCCRRDDCKQKQGGHRYNSMASLVWVDVLFLLYARNWKNQSQATAIDMSTDAPPIILIVEHISHNFLFSWQNYVKLS